MLHGSSEALLDRALVVLGWLNWFIVCPDSVGRMSLFLMVSSLFNNLSFLSALRCSVVELLSLLIIVFATFVAICVSVFCAAVDACVDIGRL